MGLAPVGEGLVVSITPEQRAAALAKVERLRAAITSGRIVVPATPAELEKFTPPPETP